MSSTTTTTTTTSKRTSYTRPSSALATSTSAPNTTGSFMAIPTGNSTATPTSPPPTSSPIFAMERPTARVRFDASCILIPESSSLLFAGGGSKRPRMVTKSYSLPLWKKQKRGEDTEDGEESAHVVLKVALPSSLVMTPAIGTSRAGFALRTGIRTGAGMYSFAGRAAQAQFTLSFARPSFLSGLFLASAFGAGSPSAARRTQRPVYLFVPDQRTSLVVARRRRRYRYIPLASAWMAGWPQRRLHTALSLCCSAEPARPCVAVAVTREKRRPRRLAPIAIGMQECGVPTPSYPCRAGGARVVVCPEIIRARTNSHDPSRLRFHRLFFISSHLRLGWDVDVDVDVVFAHAYEYEASVSRGAGAGAGGCGSIDLRAACLSSIAQKREEGRPQTRVRGASPKVGALLPAALVNAREREGSAGSTPPPLSPPGTTYTQEREREQRATQTMERTDAEGNGAEGAEGEGAQSVGGGVFCAGVGGEEGAGGAGAGASAAAGTGAGTSANA
ncbi:hypothetical protein C8F04DRAFT_1191827 [Mycena alexandri]|uniref:Uncharacterized protein n=1 Tax=Mycena alexandri TaxID=1745969 RepID=A0AAD6WS32_9AGAR|nr:hypothetical protein C8F04DRAFT_1191827 [Mycena alexandri]